MRSVGTFVGAYIIVININHMRQRHLPTLKTQMSIEEIASFLPLMDKGDIL